MSSIALQAMLAKQAAHMAQVDAERESLEKMEAAKKAAKAEKAAKRAAKKNSAPTAKETVSVASGTPVDSAPSGTAPIKGCTGSDASGFVTFRGERYHGIEGWAPGTAGADHEVRKMIGSGIARASAMVEESDESGKLAAQYERKTFEAHQAGNMEEKELLAEMAIEERAMAQYKLLLAEKILSEVEACDVEALARRYRDAGNAELTTETILSFQNGSFPGASLDANGVPVFEKSGETVVPLSLNPSTMDERRARCRKALAHEAEKNSAPVETPAAIVNVSEADREAARAAELAALLAESAADDTDQIAEYLE